MKSKVEAVRRWSVSTPAAPLAWKIALRVQIWKDHGSKSKNTWSANSSMDLRIYWRSRKRTALKWRAQEKTQLHIVKTRLAISRSIGCVCCTCSVDLVVYIYGFVGLGHLDFVAKVTWTGWVQSHLSCAWFWHNLCYQFLGWALLSSYLAIKRVKRQTGGSVRTQSSMQTCFLAFCASIGRIQCCFNFISQHVNCELMIVLSST